METIGSRLRYWIEQRGWTVGTLADKLAIKQPAASMLLNGAWTPGNKTQQKLRALGCDIEWLMTGKTPSDRVAEEGGKYVTSQQRVAELERENSQLRERLAALERLLSPELIELALKQSGRKS